ncbi:MAG: hypothetical protein JTT12_05615 [Candidatus Brockarchaeota archaeon]|nr:hypothetical protein [Candidatus Brockarchaeota archaeon]
MISIDIDEFNVFTLYKTIWKGLKLGLKFERAEISPSGNGFHVIFSDEVDDLENIIYRAILDDDPYRLRYSIKRYSMGGQVDICFSVKNKKKSKKIEEKLLNLEELKKAERIEEVIKLAENSEVNKLKPEFYITVIPFDGEELREKVAKIIEDIEAKDESFKASIYRSYLKDYYYVIVIKSPDKNQAYQRGEWFLKILKKEFQYDTFYWVKHS